MIDLEKYLLINILLYLKEKGINILNYVQSSNKH
jgi:hypothetical protein